jgi:hypothetical protein
MPPFGIASSVVNSVTYNYHRCVSFSGKRMCDGFFAGCIWCMQCYDAGGIRCSVFTDQAP